MFWRTVALLLLNFWSSQQQICNLLKWWHGVVLVSNHWSEISNLNRGFRWNELDPAKPNPTQCFRVNINLTQDIIWWKFIAGNWQLHFNYNFASVTTFTANFLFFSFISMHTSPVCTFHAIPSFLESITDANWRRNCLLLKKNM